jgi:hypothetical protein
VQKPSLETKVPVPIHLYKPFGDASGLFARALRGPAVLRPRSH